MKVLIVDTNVLFAFSINKNVVEIFKNSSVYGRVREIRRKNYEKKVAR